MNSTTGSIILYEGITNNQREDATMNIIQLYQDYSIPYYESGNNVGVGWINIQCPFCNDPSNHLGFNLEHNWFKCWRCGFHPTMTVIAKLLNINEQDAQEIIRNYGGMTFFPERSTRSKAQEKPFRFPPGTEPLSKAHWKYLCGRNFDPHILKTQWDIRSTGPMSILDGSDYKHRIIAPITWNRKVVSFQSRAVTDRQIPKYKSCPPEREIVPYKNILYGQQAKWGKTGICVEGITDVWRLGPTAFATFGVQFTVQQVTFMARAFKRIIVLYDNDPPGQAQADKLVAELHFRAVEAGKVNIDGDPGSMAQDDADHLVKEIMK